MVSIFYSSDSKKYLGGNFMISSIELAIGTFFVNSSLIIALAVALYLICKHLNTILQVLLVLIYAPFYLAKKALIKFGHSKICRL